MNILMEERKAMVEGKKDHHIPKCEIYTTSFSSSRW
jgi:hypothetical protein